ncbi:MAG: (2Fe-2S)-binding protein [Candidatus Izemoplasmatales bacterium]|jgi:NAD(P)H-nitrite reductase large subunit|nr:(2Fe-2S)-binding protein [Candidatus Izemoplasmatales bacterium]
MNKKDIIICRCEDISLAEVHEALEMGYTTVEDIKRVLRAGMGPCQGQTCSHLIQAEIAKYLKVNKESVKFQKTRPLVTGVVLADIAKAANKEVEEDD